MPTRTRKAGFEVEGLGIVYLEASATGLPVVAGDSGGAPDAVRDGDTGHVVDGTTPNGCTRALVSLLNDRAEARAMGSAGRAWAVQRWRWDSVVGALEALLRPPH